eukprot:m.12521 g.12521  ORF g.12521 m.12521 type:complete len:53 (+) comp24110_c0_seq2:290-448(+)
MQRSRVSYESRRSQIVASFDCFCVLLLSRQLPIAMFHLCQSLLNASSCYLHS